LPERTQERTEAPTPRRRREAREQGQVARSNDLGSAAVLLGGLVALYGLGAPLLGRLIDIIRNCLGSTDDSIIRPDAMLPVWRSVVVAVGAVILPFMLALLVVGVVIQIAQVGWHPTFKPLMPRGSRLNPLNGFRRLFSARTAVQTAMNTLKMALVLLVAYSTLRDKYAVVVGATGLHDWAIMGVLAQLMFSLALRLAIVLLVLGVLDYLYQRYKFEQDLKMTKEEVKEELRSMEGDPKIKSRRRRVQIEMAVQRMKSAVPKADVVVTNPTEYAVALQYDEATMAAPKVVAKGKDYMAAQIRRLAIEHGVPILERKPLAQALYKTVEVGQEIPPEFYRAVAEILAYVYELTGKNRRREGTRGRRPVTAGA